MDSDHDHEKQHAFFQYPHFAVVGASDDDKKWGGLVSAVPRNTVIFRLTCTLHLQIVHLFKERAKDVIPVNPVRTDDFYFCVAPLALTLLSDASFCPAPRDSRRHALPEERV